MLIGARQAEARVNARASLNGRIDRGNTVVCPSTSLPVKTDKSAHTDRDKRERNDEQPSAECARPHALHQTKTQCSRELGIGNASGLA